MDCRNLQGASLRKRGLMQSRQHCRRMVTVKQNTELHLDAGHT